LILRKVVLDTNVYVDWLNQKLGEEWVVAPGLVRYLSAVVHMELLTGARTPRAQRAVDQLARAYGAGKRILSPGAEAFGAAGRALRALRARGIEVRRASLVNDVLIAQSARAIGATVITQDHDYEAIRSTLDFELRIVPPNPSAP
jgi:predicted nucleic acid-binding protein